MVNGNFQSRDQPVKGIQLIEGPALDVGCLCYNAVLRAMSLERKPRNGGRRVVALSTAPGVETRMAPNRKSRFKGDGL